jgi:MFS family permease
MNTPGRRRRRVAASVTVALVLAGLLAPAIALSHGLVGKTDLPIPSWLFAWAAAIVLVVSFVALAALWPEPRLEQLRDRRLWRYPRALEPLLGLIGVGLFVVVVYSGFAGSQQVANNLAPTFVFVLFWVGLVFVSLLVGDVFRAVNPWRATARAA